MSVEVGMHVCGRYEPFSFLLLGKCVHRGIVSQKRGSESKQVGIPLMSSSKQ